MFFNTITQAISMLRQYDAVDYISLFHLFSIQSQKLFGNSFVCVFIQNYKFKTAALTWSKQIRHFLQYQ